jgi:hypothetical protein
MRVLRLALYLRYRQVEGSRMQQLCNGLVGTALGVFLLLGAGCGSSTEPGLAWWHADGTYVLESSLYGGPTTGTFRLTRDGRAVRRVQYSGADGVVGELTYRGTFRLPKPDAIVFSLQDGPDYIWHIRGVRAPTTFTITYGNPRGGETAETYRRVDP